MTAAYLDQQISAGADAVQIFDTWAGILNEAEYRRFVLPALQRLFVQLRRRNVPLTYFALNSGHLLSAIRECGASIIGVDAHTSLTTARTILGERVLQGNLDPLILMNDEVAIRAATQRVLADGAGGPHIFNVGHGLQPTTPISALEIVLDEIRGSQL
jgi:uroporphyrinogen decarboxylase